jgi:hypothetical protein
MRRREFSFFHKMGVSVTPTNVSFGGKADIVQTSPNVR